MGPARIYLWRRMHRSRAPLIAPGTFFVTQSWAGCITNMPGFNLRQPQPKRVAFSAMDRLIFVGLYRLVPNTIKALTIVKPDTVIRWHRAGFRLYWRWKSRHRCGRPIVLLEIRRLIREMSI